MKSNACTDQACKLLFDFINFKDLSKILLFINDNLCVCKFYSFVFRKCTNSFNDLLFSSAGEGNENMMNQQKGEVIIPHLGDRKLEAQADYVKCFVLELLKYSKLLKYKLI